VITIPPKVKVGETVIYRTWGATEVKINNEKYVLVDQKDVLGVVHES
jgi:co-chaperonin GroES (HSP10)